MVVRSAKVHPARDGQGATELRDPGGDTVVQVRRAMADNGEEDRPLSRRDPGNDVSGKLAGQRRRLVTARVLSVRERAHRRNGLIGLGLVTLALILLLPPWVAPALFVGVVVAAIAMMAVLGYDGLSELAIAHYRHLQIKDPERAEAQRARAARIAARLNRLIEVLPESWTRGLYIPDFEPGPEPPEKMRADPFERLPLDMRA